MEDEQSDESDDHTRLGRQQSTGGVPSGLSKEGSGGLSSNESEDGDTVDQQKPGEEDGEDRDEDLLRELIARQRKSDNDNDNRNGPAELISLGLRMSTVGPLPPASEFIKYPPNIQERMCRWQDAFTIDESKRQDQLVDNEIKQSRIGSILSSILLIIFGSFSLASFLITRDANSAWFLSVPVASIIGNIVQPVFSKSSRFKDKSPKQIDE